MIELLLEHDTAGDPITGLKWTRRTTAKIAIVLADYGIEVSANTVARLLHQMGYSLRVNRKQIPTDSSPERNRQFLYISDLRDRFHRHSQPIISIDTKKRELVGNFKNAGRRWGASPLHVNDHDFPSDAIGVAIPYGIYDVSANRGCVTVGVSHDTAAFAVGAIARWWRHEGSFSSFRRAPVALARRYWRQQRLSPPRLQDGTAVAGRRYSLGLTVTVAHYPTGASKWNPIEHRLFSEISKNWAGEPLESYDKILGFIRSTHHPIGPVRFCLPGFARVPDRNDALPSTTCHLSLTPADILTKWNYTIAPH